MNKEKETSLETSQPLDAGETTRQTPSTKRTNKLKKRTGAAFATGLIATSLLLSACGGQDCAYVYNQVNQPGSSGFTGSNSQTTPQPQTYCYGSGNSSYGRSYVYVGAGS